MVNTKVKIWVFIEDLGDGSAALRVFGSEEKANSYADHVDSKHYSQRFCDDIDDLSLEFDENGKLINEYSFEKD